MKIKIILIFFLFTTEAFSQKYVDGWNLCTDKITVDKIRKYHKLENNKLLIYQPAKETLDFSSILLIKEGKSVRFWEIKNDTIVKTGRIEHDLIFDYVNIAKTGVRKTEHDLKFVPPIVCCNAIIYIDYKYNFYFEDDIIPGTYVPNCNYQKYRIEWTRIIKNEIDSIKRNPSSA